MDTVWGLVLDQVLGQLQVQEWGLEKGLVQVVEKPQLPNSGGHGRLWG